jgi:hypothetical protein
VTRDLEWCDLFKAHPRRVADRREGVTTAPSRQPSPARRDPADTPTDQISVQPMPGPNVAHAGHTAPATGGTGRDDRLKGDATVACTDTSTTNATEPGHHRAHVA